jgi:outer membrane murein-binding lipoprotein Lpp
MNMLHSSIRHDDHVHDDYAENNNDGALHFSPGLAPTEHGYEYLPRYEPTVSAVSRARRRPFGTELLRFVFGGLVIAAIFSAAFASQYGEPETIQAFRTIKKTLNRLPIEFGIVPSVMTTSRPASLRSLSSVQDRSILDEKPTVPAVPIADHFQRQLDTIASDVTNVKALVEQLTGSQRQMATQIAAVKAVNDSLNERTWWLTQSAAFNAPPSKGQHKVAHSSPTSTAIARP